MIKSAKRLNVFSEYIFSRLQKKVKAVEAKSKKKVLDFGAGNPDVKPSFFYLKKFDEFLTDGKSHLYPGFGANNEFSQALINWYKKRFKVNLKESEVFPLLGAKDGVSHLPLALLDPDDEVLVPDPGYPAYTDTALMVGGRVVYYNPEKLIDVKISKKTKFMWVNFPSNPTGQVISLEQLDKLVKFAKKHNLIIAYDNAYSEITFDNYIAPSILQIPGAKNIAIELGSFSKTFSFAGFRMGWIVGNSKVITALAKVKSQMDSGLSTPLQKLGAFALNHPDKKWHQQMIKSYQQRRDIIANYLKQLGLTFTLPKGSLYIWAKIPADFKDAEQFCNYLLEKKQILVTPGSAFGKSGKQSIRISICTNIDQIENYF
ncbi:aminotransferase class I/II-fold pyridoxal phosphate-dependent enzyme [Candidatus Daviesbacteria bacterium]|nr:aminotransferase class I/II-fold pyridoxal phosphate-dependent enzyme [Candidatus Daviesbacteria bacterium]